MIKPDTVRQPTGRDLSQLPVTKPPTRILARTDRILLVVAGSVLVLLLVTARFLEPSPEGMGTHRQLGLPSCSFVSLYGMPCPSCGMTTSWSCFVRGDLISAVAANPGGLLLALIAVAAIPWLLVSGIRGRWLFGPLNNGVALTLTIIVPTVTLIHWIIRLNS